MKAIETYYNGYRFRSRLEARWAVFFDTLGVSYEYEKEGFDLGTAGLYLPDFWLPEQKCWIEIKGQEPTAEEQEKAHALAKFTGKDVFLFFGEVTCPKAFSSSESAYKCFADDGWDCSHWWCECDRCGLLGIEFQGNSDRLPCNCKGPSANYSTPRLIAAYEAARSVRFEFGEKGSNL